MWCAVGPRKRDHLRCPVSSDVEQAVRDDVTLQRIRGRLGQGLVVYRYWMLHLVRLLSVLCDRCLLRPLLHTSLADAAIREA